MEREEYRNWKQNELQYGLNRMKCLEDDQHEFERDSLAYTIVEKGLGAENLWCNL
jgi:hypothetical protein